MNTITIQNQDGSFTVFNADVTITAYDGSQAPTPIFTGTLEIAQEQLDEQNRELANVQSRADQAQAVVDGITNFDPTQVATLIQNFKDKIANPVQTITPPDTTAPTTTAPADTTTQTDATPQ